MENDVNKQDLEFLEGNENNRIKKEGYSTLDEYWEARSEDNIIYQLERLIMEKELILKLIKAVDFAANKHKNQMRKGVEAAPYINHPIQVARLIIEVGEVRNINIILAAILHDTIEDTETTKEELLKEFGEIVTNYVLEMTDDKSLEKSERKRLQVLNASHKSPGAKLIKICDKICNITDVTHNPPSWWDLQRRKDYLDWAEKVVNALGEVNLKLNDIFNERLKEGRSILNAG